MKGQTRLATNVDIEKLDKDEQLRAAEYGLINIYFSPAKMEDAGSKFLTLAEISAKIARRQTSKGCISLTYSDAAMRRSGVRFHRLIKK